MMTTTNAWKCPTCGGLFWEGTSHYCPGNSSTALYVYNASQVSQLELERLQKIADKYGELFDLLRPYLGEISATEGIANTLKRILQEYELLKRYEEWAEGWK